MIVDFIDYYQPWGQERVGIALDGQQKFDGQLGVLASHKSDFRRLVAGPERRRHDLVLVVFVDVEAALQDLRFRQKLSLRGTAQDRIRDVHHDVLQRAHQRPRPFLSGAMQYEINICTCVRVGDPIEMP